MNRCAYRCVKSLLATTLPSGGGGARPDGCEPQACKSASLAMALFKILGSGLSYFCTGSLLLNFGLSIGAYAQPISVPDLTVMVVADGRATIVGISTLVATPTLFGYGGLSSLESAL